LFEAQRIRLTPLRERASEIVGIVGRFLEDAGPKGHQIQKDALEFLVQYPWPGNLKELEDCLGTMIQFALEGTLTMEDIPLDLLIKQAELSPSQGKTKHVLKKVNRQFERKYIRRVLEESRGNQTQAAETLGLHRNTLILKLKELNLENEYEKIVRKRRELGLGFRER
jgi:DNA-binding NtrC family response regulator